MPIADKRSRESSCKVVTISTTEELGSKFVATNVEDGDEEDSDGDSDDDDDDDEEEPVYSGSIDKLGRPHGRGSLTYGDSETVFRGRFIHGIKSGRGSLSFGDGSVLSGQFVDDSLSGPGEYFFADGSRLCGLYTEGELNGFAEEWNSSNICIFRGSYKENTRCGQAMIMQEDKGWFFGTLGVDEMLTGEAIYVYPDGQLLLFGIWDHGEMKSAKFAQSKLILDPMTIDRLPSFSKKEIEYIPGIDYVYTRDVSTSTRFASDYMMPDFWESRTVRVDKSLIPNSGEGLFAKVDIPSDSLICFYNGVRCSPVEVDKRPWEDKSNAIALDDDVVFDVSLDYSTIDKMCASVGHKCNHSFIPNATYDTIDHPRYGKIRSIRSLRIISQGDEILVCYGYEYKDNRIQGPQWYLDSFAAFIASGGDSHPQCCKPCCDTYLASSRSKTFS